MLTCNCTHHLDREIFNHARYLSQKAVNNEDFLKIKKTIETQIEDSQTTSCLPIRHVYRVEIKEAMIDRVWSVLKQKARHPETSVAVITQCVLLDEKAPLGFIRQPTISLPFTDKAPFTIKEHVLQQEQDKTILFVQLDGDFLASNTIEQEEGRWKLAGYYIYNSTKSTKEFTDEMQKMMGILLKQAHNMEDNRRHVEETLTAM